MLTGKYNSGVPAGSRGEKTNWLETKLNDRNLDRVKRFCKLAREAGHEPGHMALAWILLRPEVACVITGATHPEQVLANVRTVDLRIAPDLAQRIESIFPTSER
jgi:aryl-alcohol dehydrogenase-like predicted oxidoreductase